MSICTSRKFLPTPPHTLYQPRMRVYRSTFSFLIGWKSRSSRTRGRGGRIEGVCVTFLTCAVFITVAAPIYTYIFLETFSPDGFAHTPVQYTNAYCNFLANPPSQVHNADNVYTFTHTVTVCVEALLPTVNGYRFITSLGMAALIYVLVYSRSRIYTRLKRTRGIGKVEWRVHTTNTFRMQRENRLYWKWANAQHIVYS